MITCVSDDSMLIRLGEVIEPSLTSRIATYCRAIEARFGDWLIDLVPSYTTILVVYDPLRIDFRGARRQVSQLLADTTLSDTQETGAGAVHDIPVYYHPECGPDLQTLADAKGLTIDEVVDYHTSATYQVYAIGFLPGFGFLGSVDEAIAAPRHRSPRDRVPAGSVGIANRQTAIYPKASPGGWQIIGRSPTPMFDVESLSLLQVGDRVRFHAVSRDEFRDLGGSL
ncbi:MAG: 5-oxoprolinase subunit PxpB [Marinobacter sp.]|uniref:5-oxoprolinase subunit PxpB n=1 Tax=Marinobacter sp. TaxID=50741 RepID=UPI00299F1C06|nr:5-oxoprolinase subunit PxpB [Marinobacter sp.]MDX1755001.1 5-oxoprolinase subunit PxpB [Marinobacter sp.]